MTGDLLLLNKKWLRNNDLKNIQFSSSTTNYSMLSLAHIASFKRNFMNLKGAC